LLDISISEIPYWDVHQANVICFISGQYDRWHHIQIIINQLS